MYNKCNTLHLLTKFTIRLINFKISLKTLFLFIWIFIYVIVNEYIIKVKGCFSLNKFFKKLAVVLSFSMLLTAVSPGYSAFANTESDDLNPERLLTEDEFLYDVGFEDVTIDEFAGDNMPDYVDDSVEEPHLRVYYAAPVVVWIVVAGIRVSRIVYKAIKYAPKYPSGFKAVQNGTKM